MKQFRREPLRNGEPDRLLAACRSDFDRGAIGVLLETGLRLSELAMLKPGDVNEAEARVNVLGKGQKRRVVPLSVEAVGGLKAWFGLKKGGGKRTIQMDVHALGERAGLNRPLFCHLFRHTWAVKCLRHGISLRSLQLALGHSSLNTTAGYLNLSGDTVCQEFKEKWT